MLQKKEECWNGYLIPNSIPWRFPSYLHLTLLLYFLSIFYLTQCTPPGFPSISSLPFLSCCHRTTTTESTIDSEGFKGGTRGAPIMPRDTVSRTANVERTGRHKWVKLNDSLNSQWFNNADSAIRILSW